MTISIFIFVLGIGFFAGSFGAVVGSSLLVVVPSLVFLGLPVHIALGTGKLSAVFRDIPAILNYHRDNKVDFRNGCIFTLGAVVSTVCASAFILSLEARTLEVVISVCMVLVGVIILANPSAGLTEKPTRSVNASIAKIFGAGAAIGIYDGLFGGGVSIFIILCFVWLLGHDFLKAVGTSKIPNIVNGTAFVCIFAAYDKVDFVYAIPLLIGMTLGGYYGSKLALLRGNNLVRILLIIVVFGMSAKLLLF